MDLQRFTNKGTAERTVRSRRGSTTRSIAMRDGELED
jgi:hypothetical protein